MTIEELQKLLSEANAKIAEQSPVIEALTAEITDLKGSNDILVKTNNKLLSNQVMGYHKDDTVSKKPEKYGIKEFNAEYAKLKK